MNLTNPFLDQNGDKLREECGVFGVIGAVEAAGMTALGLHALQHRGQEAVGMTSYDGVDFYTRRGLGHVAQVFGTAESLAELPGKMASGHVRYSTTGGSGLRNVQPLFADLASGGFSIAHNGNISSAMTLKKELVQRGAIFQSTSDTEVILEAFGRWGIEGTVKRLIGMFAIALWDGRRRELVLARDRVGMKPLFFGYADNGDLVFGSEVKALFVHSGMRRAINPAAVAQVFSFWTLIDGYSPFAGVHQVEAGHVYRFAPNRALAQKLQFWTIPFSGGETDNYASDAEAIEAFRAGLREAVALRLRSDVEIGTYTSGGIDSAVVNQVAYRDLGHSETQTFSVQFESDYYDESPYQKMVADHFDLTFNAVRCGSDDIVSAFEQAIFHTEAPIFRTAPVSNFYLSKAVQDKGIKVVLTGEGSDEVAWGYDIYREAKLRRFWSRFPDSTVRPQLFRRLYSYLLQFQNPRYFNLSVDFFKTDLGRTDDPLYSHMTRLANCQATHTFFGEAMRSDLEGRQPVDLLRARLPQDFERRSLLERCQYLEMQTLLTGYLMASQGDRMQSAHGVEGRYPFLDHNVIALLARMPESLKVRGLRDKFIVRETFRDDLPKDITHRPKFAYRAPEAEAFVDTLKSSPPPSLTAERLEEAGLFEPAQVENLMRRMKNSRLERFPTRDNMAFIGIYSTQVLHDQFIRRFERMRREDALSDTYVVDWDPANMRRRLRPCAGAAIQTPA